MPDKHLIQGPAGELEVLIDTPPGWDETKPVAIVCHPHPLHGGSMQNKVVHILAKTFLELGAKVIRFNFRGVGKSAGEFDNAVGEQDDLLCVVEWARQLWGTGTGGAGATAPLWLAGFSFGAYIAAVTEARVKPGRLVLVAPPVEMYPAIQEVSISTVNWILVQGEQDEIVNAEAVKIWAQQQASSGIPIFMPEAGHFFHGRLNQLKDQLLASW